MKKVMKVTNVKNVKNVVLLAGFMLSLAGSAVAQDAADDSLVARPMATRAQLTELLTRLQNGPERGGSADLAARVNMRLTAGDFRPGTRILLAVRGDTALTDTFTVQTDRSLRLPSPTVGTLSLTGVLRSELQDRLQTFIARFIERPVVQAKPLLRISIQGEVERAGYYTVPADALIGDAIMAAGGTTANADLRKARVERGRDRIYEGDELHRTIASGATLDEGGLRDGDQIIFPTAKKGAVADNLRFVALLVSITGGVYGLSRAF